MRFGLTVSGTVFSMGISAASGRPRIRPIELMERARAANLCGVEISPALLEGEDLAAVARYAHEHQLFITLASGGYNPTVLSSIIELAVQVGAPVLRIAVGGARLGGDRRALAGRWQPFLREALTGLRKATPIAERAGVILAAENHQDLTSEELLSLCETISSPNFGITLDTANPLATAEEPLDFARHLAPYLKNVHLKDYQIYLSNEGYRLVRCPLGAGVIDFPSLFSLLAAAHPSIPIAIEHGALEARHIRVLADDYWPDYPSRPPAQIAHALHFVHTHARSGEDWRTPFERNEPIETIIAYEERQLAQSLAYLASLQPDFLNQYE